MLLTSPKSRPAASPRETTSSQASSAGSTYASSPSTASSTRLQTDPASNSTSPATLSDRASVQSRMSQRGKSAPHTSDPLHASITGPPTVTNSSIDPSVYRDPTSSAVSNSMSQAQTTFGWPDTSSQQPPVSASPSTTDLQHTLSTSPGSNRGPASKARRTSPGGSRASGDLHVTGGNSQQSMTHHADSTRRASVTDARRSHSPPSFSRGDSGSHPPPPGQRPDSTDHVGPELSAKPTSSDCQQAPVYRPGQLSPRSKVNSNSLATSPSTFGTGASVASSTGVNSDLTKEKDLSPRSQSVQSPRMNLAKHPPQELLKILATLLHEIATANDEFQPDGSKDDPKRSRRGPRSRDRSAPSTPADGGDNGSASSSRDFRMPHGSHLSFNDERRPSVTTAALGALATPSSTLCFHARNVPSISIESYLLRILKYCPTTNEVFLSLLVYFDRMSRMGSGAKPGSNGDGELAGEAAGLPRASERASGRLDRSSDSLTRGDSIAEQPYTHPGIRGFAIDSYNVHRLVIAGITVASKFFSDVFYTNSRYAKVGGLPPHELNQLELQFLLLNDFRLTIPLEEMQRYADQLLAYGSGRTDNLKLPTELTAPPRIMPASTSAGGVATEASHAAEVTASQETDGQGDVQMQDA